MQYYTMLYYTILYYTILYYTILVRLNKLCSSHWMHGRRFASGCKREQLHVIAAFTLLL